MGLIITLIFIAIVFVLLWRDIMKKQAPYNDPTKVDATWPFPDAEKPTPEAEKPEAEKPVPFPTGKKP